MTYKGFKIILEKGIYKAWRPGDEFAGVFRAKSLKELKRKLDIWGKELI